MGIKFLTEQEAVEQIVHSVEIAETGTAPFALVLGSGFSHGLVPMVREIINESLPLWMYHLKNKIEFENLKKKPAPERAEIAKKFWYKMVNDNRDLKKELLLDPNTGIPNDLSSAYKAAFDSRYNGALGNPADARKFQRELMRLDQPRLNAAHFLLASLLGVQPGKSRKSELFKTDAAFSRLILTTNFDPFLQTALQMVNRLYFMSDTMEMGVNDEIFDDYADSIHLVYVHGSIHRRSQAASDDEIQELKEKNARMLAPVLKRHGVIVLGYSGWDDAIVEALAACNNFDHRLYWCGLENDPMVKGSFGPRVCDILQKSTAFYVQTKGAGPFMAKLCEKLINGLPRLLVNPIGQVREILETIDLKEFEKLAPPKEKEQKISDRISPEKVIAEAKVSAIRRLNEVELTFQSKGKAQQLLSEARLAGSLNNYEEALKLCDEALGLPGLASGDRAELQIYKGVVGFRIGKSDDAIADWANVIYLSEVPVEQMAVALINSGVVCGQKGETEKSLAAYTRVIELSEAPVEYIAQALVYRGVIWGWKGETEKSIADFNMAIDMLDAPIKIVAQALVNRGVMCGKMGEIEKSVADYTRVIELPEAQVEHVALAFLNRGITWGKIGETENEIADYMRVIELTEAPVEHVAKAFYNRGVAWGKKGEIEKSLADYTRVIEMPGAPVEYFALALVNRGVACGKRGEIEKELADYTLLIDTPDVPVKQMAQALVNRGIAWGEQGENEKLLADYTRVIDLPYAPVDQIAKALCNRGITWDKKGETEKSLADYARIIELTEAPVEYVTQALVNRGVTLSKKGETEKSLADYTRVIEIPDAPVKQVAQALINRGITLSKKGETEKSLVDYTRVIDLPDAPIEYVAQALINRGLTWGINGETEKELADYTRVTELPEVPVDQIADAFANRGWSYYAQNEFASFLADTEAALDKNPSMKCAAFNLGLALLACGRDSDALTAYQRAGETYPQSIVSLGLEDLIEAKKSWLSEERAAPVIQLLESFNKQLVT